MGSSPLGSDLSWVVVLELEIIKSSQNPAPTSSSSTTTQDKSEPNGLDLATSQNKKEETAHASYTSIKNTANQCEMEKSACTSPSPVKGAATIFEKEMTASAGLDSIK